MTDIPITDVLPSEPEKPLKNFQVKIVPDSIVLTNNPVRLDITCDATEFSYTISSDSNDYYTGSGEDSLSVFIQDILSQIVAPVKLQNESPDILIPIPEMLKNISITINSYQNDATPFTLSFKALSGGVSKRTLRRLNNESSNIFLKKLLNPDSNFAMTTRTAKRCIAIKENELLPLSFLYPSGTLKVKTGGIEIVLPGTSNEPYALNIFRLRKKIFEEHQILASVFDVYVGSTLSFTIVITPGSASKECYLLEFLNSWGVYERVEVTGIGVIKPEAGEDRTYMSYDSLIDDYIESRERTDWRNILTVESGFKTSAELSFLLDMLSSDDICILGHDGRRIKVNATADDLTLAARSTSPESLKLTLRFADSETRYTEPLSEDFL